MRWLPLAALALLACGGSNDRLDTPATRDASRSLDAAAGPDAVVLRVASAGGRVRAYVYPRLDSAVWTSSDASPPIARVLGFDESAGSLAVVDGRGVAQRVSLRLGSVGAATRTKLTSLASADGYGIYGVGGNAVMRLTPSEARPWSVRFGAVPRDVIPQSDGSVLVVADRDDETLVWRVRPPESAASDTAVLPRVGRAIAVPSGDRIYFVADSGLVGVRGSTLESIPAVPLEHSVRHAVVTPSGDRLYLVTDSSTAIQVVDRYRGEVTASVALPGRARELRMDPLGRYLLARAGEGDSTWVVAIGTDRLLGAVRTAWRADLPFVAPDGLIATARGNDVVFVDGETLRDRRRVAGGARDFWHLVVWNGFRRSALEIADRRSVRAEEPRSSAADATDSSESADSATASEPAAPTTSDSTAGASGTSAAASDSSVPARLAAPPSAAVGRPPVNAAGAGFTVQFAAVASEPAAREVAAAIRFQGAPPRIVATQTSGTILYRVVLGPFSTEADAERAGKQSGRDYWVYEGEP